MPSTFPDPLFSSIKDNNSVHLLIPINFIGVTIGVVIIQLMVYGKILFNNIKEYTPKWFPTIPYSQTVKPVFGTSAII
jgi:hypothetical protein